MRLVMIGEHPVYSKTVLDGEEFDVPDGEGEQWKKIGWARDATPEETKKRGRYNRRDMRAENTREMTLGAPTEDE
jgi:hypothetical protein